MEDQIVISNIEMLVERKDIKNMYIRILPPDGKVKITVPKTISDDAIRMFAISRIAWIKKQKANFENQSRQTKRQYISGESHFLWGKRYRLEVVYSGVRNDVFVKGDKLFLQVRKESTQEQRETVMEEWYREQIKQAIPAVLEKYAKIVGKTPDEWRVKNMRTKWGTCNPIKKRIWLNLQLAKKTPECLDYVIVHELVHLYVKNHNDEFRTYMDQFYPNWQVVKKQLNEQMLDWME